MLSKSLLFTCICLFIYISRGSECDIDSEADILSTIFSDTNIADLVTEWESTCNPCEWNNKYISCSTDSQNVIAIQMESLQLSGSFTLFNNDTNITYTSFPSTIKLINLNNNNLSGNIDWDIFPSSIEYLYLGGNQFHGDIDFNALNQYINLTALYLSNNTFKSTLKWNEYTGDSLQYLFLTNNQLYGTIDFETMPVSLQYIMLGYNQFNGTLDFGDGFYNATDNTSMNSEWEYTHLDVSNNALTGNISNLQSLPESIQYLRLNNNDLSGHINDILDTFINATELGDLSLSANRFYGEMNWDIFEEHGTAFVNLQSLYIHSNEL